MKEKKNESLIGIIVQAVGPVIDVKFEDKHLPEILTALKVPLGKEGKTLHVADASATLDVRP